MRFRIPFTPKEEDRMTVERMQAKLERALRRKPQTAGELAKRANLLSADGTGRAVAKPLATLVARGAAVVVKSPADRRNRYTRA